MSKADRFNAEYRWMPYKISDKDVHPHYLYFKEDTETVTFEADEKHPSHKTLYIANVHPCMDVVCFRKIFGKFGNIERVEILDETEQTVSNDKALLNRKAVTFRFKTAYIIFEKEETLKTILDKSFNEVVLHKSQDDRKKSLFGVNKWTKQYADSMDIDRNRLQREVDIWMSEYDLKNSAAKTEERNDEIADDGWITVPSSKKATFSKPKLRHKTLKKQKNEKKKKELLNFYRFQVRDSKKNNVADLQKRFEEDKLKISEMRASRKFKP